MTVSFEPASTGFRLRVQDDGPGLSADFDAKAGALGMKVIQALTQQIKGKLTVIDGLDGTGTGFELWFDQQLDA